MSLISLCNSLASPDTQEMLSQILEDDISLECNFPFAERTQERRALILDGLLVMRSTHWMARLAELE